MNFEAGDTVKAKIISVNRIGLMIVHNKEVVGFLKENISLKRKELSRAQSGYNITSVKITRNKYKTVLTDSIRHCVKKLLIIEKV